MITTMTMMMTMMTNGKACEYDDLDDDYDNDHDDDNDDDDDDKWKGICRGLLPPTPPHPSRKALPRSSSFS